MSIEVRQIIDHLDKDNTDRIVNWMYEWWKEKEDCSIPEIEDWIKNCLKKDRIPMTFGLFDGNRIIGMYQFLYQDELFTRPDIYPFLTNVYIDKEYRNKGYSKILLESVKDNFPKNTGLKEIYLYTKYKGLYEKYGWEYVETVNTYNEIEPMQNIYKLKI